MYIIYVRLKIQNILIKIISTFFSSFLVSPATVSVTEHGNLAEKQKLAECKLTLYFFIIIIKLEL